MDESHGMLRRPVSCSVCCGNWMLFCFVWSDSLRSFRALFCLLFPRAGCVLLLRARLQFGFREDLK